MAAYNDWMQNQAETLKNHRAFACKNKDKRDQQ